MELLRKCAEAYGYQMAELMELRAHATHEEITKEEKALLNAIRGKDAGRAMRLLESMLYGRK